jgi:hypothetical protein
VHDAARGGMLLGTGLVTLAVASGGIQPAIAQESFGAWPSVESCEPWIRSEILPGEEAEADKSMALLDHLRNPASSYELAFRTRLARGGAIFGDGEQLDVEVPVVTADFLGNALIDGPDYLAFVALANGPWSLAEMRRDGVLRTSLPVAEQSWRAEAVVDPAVLRLSDVLASATAAVPVAAPAGQGGHWYALQTPVDMGPGIMWDNTHSLFPVVRDADAELFIEATEDGMPLRACLAQSWWQGMDDVFGEDAGMQSAINFTRAGSTPPLPPVEWPSDLERANALDIEVPVPHGGEARVDDDLFLIWLDDEDVLPHLSATRRLLPDDALAYLRELPVEQVLELLASADAASAKAGWNRDPSSITSGLIGGSDGEAPVHARLLTFYPEFDEFGTVLAIDVVSFVDPWEYNFRYQARTDNELAYRYLLERTLEGVRFLCSPEAGGACPAAKD